MRISDWSSDVCSSDLCEMRTYDLDLTPLFRSTVGFDRMGRLLDTAFNSEAPSYPPYNIAKLDEDQYRVTMAVAGFEQDDLDITQTNNTLTSEKRRVGKGDDRQSRFRWSPDL